jgi:uncharacterized membrane protein
MEPASTILPAHIEETIRAIAELQARHDRQATPVERTIESLTTAVARPRFLLLLTAGVVLWIVGNSAFKLFGRGEFDPAPFYWLQGLIGLLALYVTIIILTTQRRADKLSGYREQLTLELSILAEQKTAKVISLLEEMRRDNPLLHNRVDTEADAMAQPSDPGAVLEALVGTEPDDLTAKSEDAS